MKTRGSEPEPCNTSLEEMRMTIAKRKVRHDGEGPANKNKKKGFDLSDKGNEASTSSTVGKERCSPAEGCDGSQKDLKKKTKGKRKVTNDRENHKNTEKSKKDSVYSVETSRVALEAKYEQLNELGAGGCGSVYAGYRKADHLPVAIKHIPRGNVFCKQVMENGQQISVEVAVMLKLTSGTPGTVGTSAAVSLIDWYDLDQELVLVLERPVPSVDLLKYIEVNGGSLQEEEAQEILKQLVEAAAELESKQIFHRDIKVENILIETSSDVPRARLIDFGLSCFFKQRSHYSVFYGTSAHVPPEWLTQWTYKAGPTTVWQLGVVLYEMLHRDASFETKSFLRNEIKIGKHLSEACQDVLQMCLSEAPEQRLTLKQLQLHTWLSLSSSS
ncbi:serine/threonine-protein kinase pim-1-like [Scomber japonicus]|uniref:serine/threonine-protein kinase pim-1-like n=1 Tax=Scomber japonicus TaxID=13676 RepID=UPI0023061332|nr:serine/threonine-protein kinase pim-1-like [Scomber japonicus]